MADPTETEEKARRRRRIALGEAIGIAALIISASGCGTAGATARSKPPPSWSTAPHSPIPLVLRGSLDDDGKVIRLAPLEGSHALDTLTLTAGAPG